MELVREIPCGIDTVATGKRIAQLISESGLKDKELGYIMGLSVQSVNKWRNARNMPDIDNLLILSRILGKKVDDLLVPRESEEAKVILVPLNEDLIKYCTQCIGRISR